MMVLGFDDHHFELALSQGNARIRQSEPSVRIPANRYPQLAGARKMQDNALPAFEFVLFIAFAVWLFLWQRGSSRRRDDDDQP